MKKNKNLFDQLIIVKLNNCIAFDFSWWAVNFKSNFRNNKKSMMFNY